MNEEYAGLPPVGAVCEHQYDGNWYIGTVVAHHKSWAIFFIDEERIQAFAGGFRYLPSEERHAAIDELTKVTCITRGEAARIYDAGYRKFEIVEEDV